VAARDAGRHRGRPLQPLRRWQESPHHGNGDNMTYTVTQIEDAILDALAPIKATQGVRTLKTYGGELDEDNRPRLGVALPAVYVVYAGSDYEEHGPRKVEAIEFQVVVADRNLRAEAEARRGSTANPGAYALLAEVRDHLCGQTLDLDASPLELAGEDAVFVGDGLAVYSASYRLRQAHTYTGT